MLFKIVNGKPVEVAQTKLPQEDVLEKGLENWIEHMPDFLGEKLLIIGRQVQVADVKDKLDLLAIDTDGNLVIIEIKRDIIGGDVDFQALKYASYVWRWDYDAIEKQAESYHKNKRNDDFNFVESLEEFCGKNYELNSKQRIIVVGREIEDKIASVAQWLRGQGADIKVVNIRPYKDGETVFVHPQIVIPAPAIGLVGNPPQQGDKPWLRDGQNWHLKERCSPQTEGKALEIFDVVKQIEGVQGPNYEQKYSVTFKVKGKNWVGIDTHQKYLYTWIVCNVRDFKVEDIAQALGIQVFSNEASLSEKLQLKSSIQNVGWGLAIRMKDDFDVQNKEFKLLLSQANKSFDKS